MNEPILVLDIRGLLIRDYNTPRYNQYVKDSNGKEIASWKNALATFLDRTFLDFLQTFPPRRVIAVWDGGNEHRIGLYEGYKKKRLTEERDPKLGEQYKELFSACRTFLAYLGVKNMVVPRQEADDAIALLCERLKGRKIFINTVDHDLLQLVSDEVTVLIKDDIYTPGTEYKHIPVELTRIAKSMLGDSTDEFVGVFGLGPDKFNRLLSAYGADGLLELEQAVKNNDKQTVLAAHQATSDPVLQMLLDKWEDWRTGYALASTNPDACYSVNRERVISPRWFCRIPSREKISNLLAQIEMAHLAEPLDKWFPKETLITVDNYQELEPALAAAAKTGMISYDFESYDTRKWEPYRQANKDYVDVLSQSVTGVSFNFGDNFQHTYYVSCEHADTNNLTPDWVKYVLQYADQIPVRVVHNAMFERTVALTNFKHEVAAPFDTKIMSSYVDENRRANLKALSKELFHYDQTTYKDVVGEGDMSQISGQQVLHYGCDDSLITSFVFDLFKLICELEGTWEFYRDYEVEHMHDESDTFIEGTRIDFEYLAKLQKEDEACVTKQTALVRQSLETNAMAKDQDTQIRDAMQLLQQKWELKQHDFDDLESEEAKAEKIRLWEKCWYAAVYSPYVEQKELPSFKPTPKGINKLLEILGIETRVDRVSSRALTEWMAENEPQFRGDERKEKFFRLMGPAVAHFAASKRTGEAYEAFEQFCVQLMGNSNDLKTVASGTELNFGSAPQMQNMLYGILGLPLRVRSKRQQGSRRDELGLPGAPATGLKAIASALVHDVSESDWRFPVLTGYKDICNAQQNASLYYGPYPLWQDPDKPGIIHPSIINCGTVTRRPTGTSPNALQVSKQGDAKIRKGYIPFKENHAYVCLDFAGQELRLTASESRDPIMLEAYLGENRKDIHSLTASGFAHIVLPRINRERYGHLANKAMDYETFIAGLHDEQMGKDFGKVRFQAKSVNFLIIYVGGPTTLAGNLIIPVQQAQEMMDNTFKLYRRLPAWQQEVIQEARKYGYVTTAYGNRRHLSADIWSQDDFLRSRQERQAVNMKAQGAAADILKIVKTCVRERRLLRKYRVRSVKPIYDEIAASVPVLAIPEYVAEMKEIMEITPPGHPVSMQVDCSIGMKSWGDVEELDDAEPETIKAFLERQKEEEAA